MEPKLMDLLVFLSENAGQTVSKQEIMEAVWPDTFVGDNVLWKCIYELRQLLEDDPQDPKVIETVPKRGYRLTVPIDVQPPSDRDQRRVLTGGLALFLLVAFSALFWWTRPAGEGNPISAQPSEPSISILVTQIENRTGDPILDRTLEFALEQELANSRSVETISRNRIEDTLVLMRKSQNSTIDRNLGREICQRDGGIDLMVTGRIEKIGSRFLLGLRLIDPLTNRIEAAKSQEIETQDQILSSISMLARWITDEVGGRKSEGVAPKRGFERVTTTSVRALHFYTEAVQAYKERDLKQAELLLRQALQEDPEFASAYLLLAWAIRYQGEDWNKALPVALPYLEGAVEHSGSTSQAERAFILGCYHDWRREYAEAVANYEMVLDLEPQHHWAFLNLLYAYTETGELSRLKPYLKRRAQSRPNQFRIQVEAAMLLIETFMAPDEAEPFLKRAREIVQQRPELYYDSSIAPFVSLGVWERWIENDIQGAISEADKVRETLLRMRDEGADVRRHAVYLGVNYLALGRLKTAEELCALFDLKDSWPWFEAQLALSRSDAAVLKPYRMETWSNEGFIPLIALRLDSEVASLLEEDQKLELRAGSKELVLGMLALIRGDPSQAVLLLEKGMSRLESSAFTYQGEVMLASLDIAEAWMRLGKRQQAIQALERVSSWRESTSTAGSLLWAYVQMSLAELYRKADRNGEAEEIEGELLQLFQFADQDHPILRRLRHSHLSEQSMSR